MEIRIGIIQNPRELSFETDEAADEVRGRVEKALGGGLDPLVVFTDTKGKQYLVATASIAYVELGGESGRKVGFIS